MSWRRVLFVVSAAEAERVSDALMDAGALSVDATDAAAGTADEQPIFGEPGSAATPWPETRLAALFPDDAPAEMLAREACDSVGLAPPAMTVESVDDADWVRLTQSQFAPIRISDRLWIVPTWCEPPEPGAIVLRLDPGLAFGTGSHPTTRLCLGWLDRHLTTGATVIDYGCGSGILAVAAALLGADRVVGIDIDPQAVTASRDNAVANGVTAEFHDARPMALPPADIVVANILANPLRVLAPLLTGLVKPGGHIVLSGILEGQADAVMEAYSPAIAFEAPAREDGWICLQGVRR
jgi:ribosomal protein L11 methyltransferase